MNERPGELDGDDFLRHARIHLVAERYALARASLQKWIEAISQIEDAERRENFEHSLPQLRCALEALKVKQGNEEARERLREEAKFGPENIEAGTTIVCGRFFADMVEADDVEDLLTTAYDGPSMTPTLSFTSSLWGGAMAKRYSAFNEGLLEILRSRVDPTDEERWQRAALLINRSVFDLRLDRLDIARSSLDAAREDIDHLMEYEVFDGISRLRILHMQSFRIDQLNSVVTLRTGDFDGAREYLDRAMEKATSRHLTNDPDDPYILRLGTAQFDRYLEAMNNRKLDDADEVLDWLMVAFWNDKPELLFEGIFDDDADTIMGIFDRWELFGKRPGVLAILLPFLSDETIEEIGQYARWNVHHRRPHIYSRTIHLALEDLHSAFWMAQMMGDREFIDELEPVIERYHEVNFDLDIYRILRLLERPSSDRIFRWSTE